MSDTNLDQPGPSNIRDTNNDSYGPSLNEYEIGKVIDVAVENIRIATNRLQQLMPDDMDEDVEDLNEESRKLLAKVENKSRLFLEAYGKEMLKLRRNVENLRYELEDMKDDGMSPNKVDVRFKSKNMPGASIEVSAPNSPSRTLIQVDRAQRQSPRPICYYADDEIAVHFPIGYQKEFGKIHLVEMIDPELGVKRLDIKHGRQCDGRKYCKRLTSDTDYICSIRPYDPNTVAMSYSRPSHGNCGELILKIIRNS